MSPHALELVPGEEQGHGDRRVDTGVGVELNLGYEFRVFRNTAVGVVAIDDHPVAEKLTPQVVAVAGL